ADQRHTRRVWPTTYVRNHPLRGNWEPDAKIHPNGLVANTLRGSHPVGTAGELEQRHMKHQQIYEAARAYVRAGLSVNPIMGDTSKRPAFELLPRVWWEKTRRYRRPWSVYKQRRPTKAELRAWYFDPDEADKYGIAVIAGGVSGGLEIIDIDNW